MIDGSLYEVRSINVIVAVNDIKKATHNIKLYSNMSVNMKYEYIPNTMVNTIYGAIDIGKSLLGPVTNLPLK